MRAFVYLGAAAALAFPTAAWADDWVLSCTYPTGLEVIVRYDAGWPRHTLEIRRPGSSGLTANYGQEANVILARSEIVLFTKNSEANARQLLVRINSERMTSTLEAGSAVSWDYLSYQGRCREVQVAG